MVTLPSHYHRHFTSNFKLDEIETVTGNQQQICIGNLNRSLTETIVIQKNEPFGFFVLEQNK